MIVIYLSFYEIYLLLNDICLNSDIDIIKELEKFVTIIVKLTLYMKI